MATYNFKKGETFTSSNVDFQQGETIVASKRTARGVPYWADRPEVWDTVILAGHRLPGVAKLTGTAMEHRVDKQSSAGKHGAKIVLQGYEAAPFDVILTLWEEEHLRTFESLIPILKRKYPAQTKTKSGPVSEAESTAMGFGGITVRGADGNLITYAQFASGLASNKGASQTPATQKGVASGPSPVDIQHPNLSMWGIRSAQVLSVGFLESKNDGDVKECRLKCLEWVGRRGASVVSPKRSSTDFTAGIKTAYSFGTAPTRRARPSDSVGPREGE